MVALLSTLWPAIVGAGITALVIYMSLRGVGGSAMSDQNSDAGVIPLHRDSHN